MKSVLINSSWTFSLGLTNLFEQKTELWFAEELLAYKKDAAQWNSHYYLFRCLSIVSCFVVSKQLNKSIERIAIKFCYHWARIFYYEKC